MRSLFAPAFFLFIAVVLTSCSSADDKAAAPKNSSNSRPTGQNTGDSIRPAEPGTNQAPAVNDQQPAVSGPDVRKSRMDALRNKAQNAAPAEVDIEAELKKSARPAPENSEFAVVLANSIFERRTFRGHPKLLKVEKVTEGEKKAIKVFLTDGRVIELPGDKIEFISTAPSAAILIAAGVEVPGARRPNSKPRN